MQVKKIINLLLILIGIFIPIFVIYKNIFPDIKVETDLKSYSYYERNLILKKNINENEYLIFPCKDDYNFSKVILEITFKEKIPSQTNIPLEKGYESMLYPLGEKITNKEQLEKILFANNFSDTPNGSLISNNETAYVVSNGKYYPISSQLDFIKLGFYWDNVKPVDNIELAKLEKGEEKIYSFNPHSDGIILRDEEENLFIISNKKRLPIESEGLLSNIWPNYSWVDVHKNTIKLAGNCEIKTNQKGINCFYKDNPASFGNTYIFDLKDTKGVSIEKVESVLKTNATKNQKNSIKIFLSKIKMRLISRLNRENEIY